MDPEEAAYLQKLREERKKNKKPSIKAVRALSCQPISVPSDFAVPYKSNNKCCKKSAINYISQSSFTGDARNGILLDKPGVYEFKGNVTFNPTVERTTAITVTASNVVVDLDRFTLEQGNDLRYTYGIAIARDVENVTITGVQNQAVILDFSLAGVRVMGRTDSIVIENITTSQTEIRQLTNDDISPTCEFINCSYINFGICVGEGEISSIAYQGTDRANIVKNITLNGVTCRKSTGGCQMVFTFGIEVLDSLITENTLFGLWFGSLWAIVDEEQNVVFPQCENGVIRNSHFDNNRGDNIDLSNPEDSYFFDSLQAIEFASVQTFLVENCTFNDNLGTGLILAVDHDGAHNMVWRDCVCLRNRSEFEICDGWHASGSILWATSNLCLGLDISFKQDINLTVERCSSMDNSAGGLSSCSGFTLAYCKNVKMTDCHASGNRGTVIGSGFNIEGNIPEGYSEDISLIRCTAESNNLENAFGSPTGTAAGLFINSTSRNIVVQDFIAQSNGLLENSPVAGGIVVFNRILALADTIANVVIDNATLNHNGNAQAPYSGGIVVRRRDGGVPLDNVLLQNNTLTNNLGSVVGVFGDINNVVIKANEADNNSGVGFDITQVPNPVLVAMNIAYDNGNGTPAGNYAGVNPAVIIEGTQNSLPSAVGALNLSITIQ